MSLTGNQLPISSTIDITYSNLLSEIQNSTLKSGQQYRITNYQSKNFLYGKFISFQDPTKRTLINTGSTESLIVSATSKNTIASQAYSELYPDDILYYNPFQSTLAINEVIFATPVFDGGLGKWKVTLPISYVGSTGLGIGNPTTLTASFNGGTEVVEGEINSLQLGVNNIDYNDPQNATLPITNLTSVTVSVVGTNLTIVFDDLTNNTWTADANATGGIIPISYSNTTGTIEMRKNLTYNVELPVDFRGYKYRRHEMAIETARTGLNLDYLSPTDQLTLPDGTVVNATLNTIDYPIFNFNFNAYSPNQTLIPAIPYPIGTTDTLDSFGGGVFDDSFYRNIKIAGYFDNVVFLQSAKNVTSFNMWVCTFTILSGSIVANNSITYNTTSEGLFSGVENCYGNNISPYRYRIDNCICANITENQVDVSTIWADSSTYSVVGNKGGGLIGYCVLVSGGISFNTITKNFWYFNIKGTLGFDSNTVLSELIGDNSASMPPAFDMENVNSCSFENTNYIISGQSSSNTNYKDIKLTKFMGVVRGNPTRTIDSATVGNAFLNNDAAKLCFSTGDGSTDPVVYNWYNTSGVLQSGLVA